MLPQDIEDQSLALFYASFVTNEHQQGPGYSSETFLNVLPAMCAQAGPQSCLEESVKAVALANWINRRNPVDLRSLLRAQYVRALKAVNEALSRPTERHRASTLMSIHLLGSFEVSQRGRS